MVTERFLYEIHPHRPIKNLIPGRLIVKPCSMKLTKEEVETCMAFGPIFRVFTGQMPIRVTGSNMALLHVAKYEEYKNKEKVPNHTQNVENDTRAQETTPEEPKSDAPRNEESVENAAPVENEKTEGNIENIIPEKTLVSSEEVTEVSNDIPKKYVDESEDESDEVVEENSNSNPNQGPTVTVNTNNKNYYKKKRH